MSHKPVFISQTEYDARCSMDCVCGNPKEQVMLVCWDCFKRGNNPLKYFNGSYDQWLDSRKVAA